MEIPKSHHTIIRIVCFLVELNSKSNKTSRGGKIYLSQVKYFESSTDLNMILNVADIIHKPIPIANKPLARGLLAEKTNKRMAENRIEFRIALTCIFLSFHAHIIARNHKPNLDHFLMPISASLSPI